MLIVGYGNEGKTLKLTVNVFYGKLSWAFELPDHIGHIPNHWVYRDSYLSHRFIIRLGRGSHHKGMKRGSKDV